MLLKMSYTLFVFYHIFINKFWKYFPEGPLLYVKPLCEWLVCLLMLPLLHRWSEWKKSFRFRPGFRSCRRSGSWSGRSSTSANWKGAASWTRFGRRRIWKKKMICYFKKNCSQLKLLKWFFIRSSNDIR